jgi:hypothetical protein
MPRVLIPSSNIAQNATTYARAGTSQTALSTIKSVYTYPQQSAPNIPLRGSQVNANYYFWTNVYTESTSKGQVQIYYPFTEGPSPAVGLANQVYTGTYPYITLNAVPAYGYFFDYWSASYPGGSAVSYSSIFNLYYYDTYYDASIYCNFY